MAIIFISTFFLDDSQKGRFMLPDYSEIQCRWAIEGDFIEQGSVQGLDTSCLSRVQPPAFDTNE